MVCAVFWNAKQCQIGRLRLQGDLRGTTRDMGRVSKKWGAVGSGLELRCRGPYISTPGLSLLCTLCNRFPLRTTQANQLALIIPTRGIIHPCACLRCRQSGGCRQFGGCRHSGGRTSIPHQTIRRMAFLPNYTYCRVPFPGLRIPGRAFSGSNFLSSSTAS